MSGLKSNENRDTGLEDVDGNRIIANNSIFKVTAYDIKSLSFFAYFIWSQKELKYNIRIYNPSKEEFKTLPYFADSFSIGKIVDTVQANNLKLLK